MQVKQYLKDQLAAMIMAAAAGALMYLFLKAFHADTILLAVILGIFAVFCLLLLLWGILRRKWFYDLLQENLEQLDQKYLAAEIIPRPGFYEGSILYDVLWEMGKSMTEHVARYQQSVTDFKEYIEMWVHEMKLPIAGILMSLYNDSGDPDREEEDTLRDSLAGQIRRLDACIDQVLYYTRSEVPEKDFLITDVSLKKIFGKAAGKMRRELQQAGFEIEVQDMERTVKSDGKWMEFILEQLLSNSIKYKASGRSPRIRVWAEKTEEATMLHVWDNGIGIAAQDLPRIFEKSFTGVNGRIGAKSTGMGLYIVKQLCGKLGHQVTAVASQGVYTEVILYFGSNDFYEMS